MKIRVTWAAMVDNRGTLHERNHEVLINYIFGHIVGRCDGRTFRFMDASPDTIDDEIEKASRRLASWLAIKELRKVGGGENHG